MILKGKKLGFTLTEISDLIGGKGATETPDLEDQLNRSRSSPRSATWSGSAARSTSAIERLRATQSRLAQARRRLIAPGERRRAASAPMPG